MLHLNRGQTLASTSHLRLQSLQTCLAEQTVISLALRAAVSNLSDHRNGAARTSIDLDSEYGRKCGAGTREYKMLQDGELDRVLDELGNVPLHARLVDLARGNGRRMETLVDTVMVERERNWWMRCREGHAGLEKLYKEVKASFGYLVNVGVVGTVDTEAEEKIEALVDEVEGNARELRDKQVGRLERLAADHHRAVDVVLDAIGSGSTSEGGQYKAGEGGDSQSQNDGEKGQRAFIILEEMSKASKDILPQMEQDDAALLEIMEEIAMHKTDAMKRMKIRLRQVSVAQSAIQKVLSQVSVLREALDLWCGDVAHLEHVQELPTAYKDFMAEVRRRRAYGEAVAATAGAMIERLAYVRDEEVKMRERFLRGSGRHLMPPFFEVFVPTLVSAPPLFAPQFPAMVEMDTLPDFGSLEKIEADDPGRASGGGITVQSLSPDDDVAGTTSDVSMENSSPIDGSGAGNDNVVTHTSDSVDEQQSLIVSADPTSTSGNDNDVIMGGIDSSHDAADKSSAQKMLAYENSVLRQALERMGGKAPRVYVEEAREIDGQKRDEEDSASVNVIQTQLDESRKELTQCKTNLDRANAALHELQHHSSSPPQLCDKISHSNIKVGDVALFMPTSAREKRDYLAFHSNCPRKYLNTDSIEGNPDYVLGRIVIQEKLVAGAKGTAANPYGLKPGTTFWVLTVEVIKVQVPSATSAATNVSS